MNIEQLQQSNNQLPQQKQNNNNNVGELLSKIRFDRNEHGDKDLVKQKIEQTYKNNSPLVQQILSHYGKKFNDMYNQAIKFKDQMNVQMSYLQKPELFQEARKYAKAQGIPGFVLDQFYRIILEDNVEFKNDFDNFSDDQHSVKGAKMLDLLQDGQSKNYDDTIKSIIKLYQSDSVNKLHKFVIMQSVDYEDCDIKALLGKYDKTDDKQNAISSVIAALFIPKFESLDQQFLLSSFGKMFELLQQGKQLNGFVEDFLRRDLIHDPNQSACFDSDSKYSESDDLLKRFKVQIELWKTVYDLRVGKYYPKDNKLMDLLDNCHTSYYDSSEFAGIYDEGNTIKKLFNVFSYRPIHIHIYPTTNLSANINQLYLQPQYVNMHQIKQKTVPMINVRVPFMSQQTHQFYGNYTPDVKYGVQDQVDLKDYLSTSDQFLENGQIVHQQYNVFDTKDIFVFYFNRRYNAIPKYSQGTQIGQGSQFQSFMGMPLIQISGLEKSNSVQVTADHQMSIQQDQFELKSVVCVKTSSTLQDVITGSYTLLSVSRNSTQNFLVYDPINVSPLGLYGQSNEPISYIDKYETGENGEFSFEGRSKQYGTIYIYKNEGFYKQEQYGVSMRI